MGKLSELDLKQYDHLASEVDSIIQQVRDTEKHVVLGAWAVWLVLASDTKMNWDTTTWWLPVVLVALGALRSAGLYAKVPRRAEYLRRLESKEDRTVELPGWDNFFLERRSDVRSRLHGWTTAALWGTLLTTSVSAALYNA